MARKNENLSRADLIRARRQMEPVRNKPVSNPAIRESRNAQNSARVVQRRTSYTPTDSNPSFRQQTRKRVYMATGSEGTEVRLPTLPNIKSAGGLSQQLSLSLLPAPCSISMSNEFKISGST